MPKPLFRLGKVVMTMRAFHAFNECREDPQFYLDRHAAGDWGELDAIERLHNERGIRRCVRLFSRYFLRGNTRIWIVTDPDRATTTIMDPLDY